LATDSDLYAASVAAWAARDAAGSAAPIAASDAAWDAAWAAWAARDAVPIAASDAQEKRLREVCAEIDATIAQPDVPEVGFGNMPKKADWVGLTVAEIFDADPALL